MDYFRVIMQFVRWLYDGFCIGALSLAISMVLDHAVAPLIQPQWKWLYLHQDWLFALSWLGIMLLLQQLYMLSDKIEKSNELHQKCLTN